MGIYTQLPREVYEELESKFILHCEAPEINDYDLYVDNVGYITFGIGFNIECNSNWLVISMLQNFQA